MIFLSGLKFLTIIMILAANMASVLYDGRKEIASTKTNPPPLPFTARWTLSKLLKEYDRTGFSMRKKQMSFAKDHGKVTSAIYRTWARKIDKRPH